MNESTDKGRRTLYPPIEPYHSDWLPVGDGHRLYFEECGNPEGKPVVALHGGPGGAGDPGIRQFFDPSAYRIVHFHQRGAGLSTPHASLVENTTWKLVNDIETLRRALAIEQWQVFGGSWGSTLALAYSQTHPERVAELILRGIFMLRRIELAWFYEQGGASFIFPDRWAEYEATIPAAERGEMQQAYYRRLTSDNEATRISAAKAWSVWEGATCCLVPDETLITESAEDALALALARIECHYFVNHGFMEDGQLLRDIGKIRSVPAVIVQGRYDVVCPMQSAYELHRAWPEADFRIVADAGHSALEAGITHELISATDRFALSA